VFDEDGNINENAPEKYQGMFKDDLRKVIVEDLKAEGYLISIDDHEHSVGECYRCKSVIEPHVSEQWFTKIFPSNWEKVYYEWLDNIRDWCISRQIWWGHRIPAWTCEDCGELIVANEDPTKCTKCGSSKLTQEEDVLDTWFSSALWPFSTLG
ncbi:Valine-tRNA ligase like protein, partial [Aduncisulcus paluster]